MRCGRQSVFARRCGRHTENICIHYIIYHVLIHVWLNIDGSSQFTETPNCHRAFKSDMFIHIISILTSRFSVITITIIDVHFQSIKTLRFCSSAFLWGDSAHGATQFMDEISPIIVCISRESVTGPFVTSKCFFIIFHLRRMLRVL